jgi:hypothetical protein
MRLISALLFASSALLAQGAAAQVRIFCCDDAKGTGSAATSCHPPARAGPMKNATIAGSSSKQVEAPLTAEQQARRDAELARRRRTKKKAAEERRRSVALLATYSSEKDIDSAAGSQPGRDRQEHRGAIAGAAGGSQQEEEKNSTATRSSTRASRYPMTSRRRSATTRRKLQAQQPPWRQGQGKGRGSHAASPRTKKRYLELTGKKPASRGPRRLHPPPIACGPRPRLPAAAVAPPTSRPRRLPTSRPKRSNQAPSFSSAGR